MSEDAENSRPAKRPRISPLLPDGFAQKSNTQARYGAPKFVSGFTNASGSGASGNNTRRLQPAQRPDFGAVAPTPATKVRVLKPPHLERISASTPSHSGSKPLNTGGAQKAKLAAVTALRHVLPAPAQASNIAGQTDRQPRTVVNILQHPPVFTKTSHAMSLKPISVAPPRPISDKPLPPSPSKLKTISTTRVAKATDPRTENGPIELLSIFLQQRGIELVDPVEKELRRGLERTPEKNKGGKGKGKYVRGGLAESFSRRFMQDSTDQKLWEEQMTRSFADGKRVKADLRLQSLTIIHRSPERLPNKPHAPMVTLVRCLVLDSQVTEIRQGPITMLFRQSANGKGQQEFRIDEGAEVCVWRPWYSLQTPGASCAFPLDLSGSPLSSGPVLMCTRFYVPHDQRSMD